MLPLTNKDKYSNSLIVRFKDKLIGWLRLIFSDKNSRNLLLFLLINLSFAFVELFYGIWTNSLGLISDSFHMFFDCTGLLAGLVASVITKWKANERFSYGYVRAEVIAGFVNGLFLLFIAFFIMSEAVERLIEPPEIKHDRLLTVSILGLVVNIIGIVVFQHGGQSHGSCGHSHSHSSSEHNHHNHNNQYNYQKLLNHGHSNNYHPNHNSVRNSINSNNLGVITSPNSHIMKGVFLHVLADTLGSVGVIVSTILMQTFGWLIADPICSMFISILIAVSVMSLIKDSVYILMQRQPVSLDLHLPECYHKVTNLQGVYSVQEPHFWTLSSDYYVGALKLEVSKNIDPKYVLSHTQMIFSSIGIKQLYVQLDYNIM